MEKDEFLRWLVEYDGQLCKYGTRELPEDTKQWVVDHFDTQWFANNPGRKEYLRRPIGNEVEHKIENVCADQIIHVYKCDSCDRIHRVHYIFVGLLQWSKARNDREVRAAIDCITLSPAVQDHLGEVHVVKHH